MNRRQFLRWLLAASGGAALTALTGCRAQFEKSVTPTHPLETLSPTRTITPFSTLTPTPTWTVTPSTTPTVTATPIDCVLQHDRAVQFLSEHPVKTGDTARKVVMMTYDDQGNKKYINRLLDIYQAQSCRATFFFIGDRMKEYQKEIQRLVSEGHILGCHGWVHEPYTSFDDKRVLKDLQKWIDLAQEMVPGVSLRFFRPPYGDKNDRLVQLAGSKGFQIIMWSHSSGGLDDKTAQRVLDGVQPGSIVLSHMLRYWDVEHAETILTGLKTKGYSVEGVDTGLALADQLPPDLIPGMECATKP